jgi:hypothetical protein
MYLACSRIFAKKWDHFFGGGMPPVVAPEGDLGFLRKAELPFNFIDSLRFTPVQPTGMLGTYFTKRTWKSFLSVEAT